LFLILFTPASLNTSAVRGHLHHHSTTIPPLLYSLSRERADDDFGLADLYSLSRCVVVVVVVVVRVVVLVVVLIVLVVVVVVVVVVTTHTQQCGCYCCCWRANKRRKSGGGVGGS